MGGVEQIKGPDREHKGSNGKRKNPGMGETGFEGGEGRDRNTFGRILQQEGKDLDNRRGRGVLQQQNGLTGGGRKVGRP